MTPTEALAQALSYLDGLREAGGADPVRDPAMLLDHLARNGFVLRVRAKHERGDLVERQMETQGIRAEEVRDMREALGLSVAALARKAGITGATLISVERGETQPHRRSVQAILNAIARAKAGVE